MKELAGKTAVVTGAANGIGRALAERFAAAGMNVVLADIDEKALPTVVASVERTGVKALAVPTDVSDLAAVEALRDAAIDRFGRVNLVCNNAGLGNVGSMMGVLSSVKDWQWVIGVNLLGVVHGHLTFLPHLKEHGDGYIVNTASMAGLMPGHSPYGGTKWAVVGLTTGLYHELKRENSTVGVSVLCPALVATDAPLHSEILRPDWVGEESLPADVRKQVVESTFEALSKGMSPADVADLVHDAVINGKYWVFTDMTWIAKLEGHYKSILSAENPPELELGVV